MALSTPTTVPVVRNEIRGTHTLQMLINVVGVLLLATVCLAGYTVVSSGAAADLARQGQIAVGLGAVLYGMTVLRKRVLAHRFTLAV